MGGNRAYPHQSETTASLSGRRGYFEKLEMCCALAMDTPGWDLLCSPEATGVLVWSKTALGHIADANVPDCASLTDKLRMMASYLFELVYELCIAPEHNVSQSAGFKTPLGCLAGSNKQSCGPADGCTSVVALEHRRAMSQR